MLSKTKRNRAEHAAWHVGFFLQMSQVQLQALHNAVYQSAYMCIVFKQHIETLDDCES